MHGTCLQTGTEPTETVTIEAVVTTENGRRAVIAIGIGEGVRKYVGAVTFILSAFRTLVSCIGLTAYALAILESRTDVGCPVN